MSDVNSPYPPGTPCWIDLVAADQRAALDFYRGLFGWEGETGSPQTGGYTICTLDGKPVAGITTSISPDGGPARRTVWTTYFATSDVDASEKAIADSGGTVVSAGTDVRTLGRVSIDTDPTGAAFGLWQARDFLGARIVNEPGAFIWSELNTGDTDAAARFYSDVMGLTDAPLEGEEGYFGLAVDGRVVAGMQGLDKLPPGTPSHWLTYFAVEDTDTTADTATSTGGKVLKPPFNSSTGRMAVLQDPQGGKFAVITPFRPESR
ncbi:VOC family protein [Streptomyces crystallinus]|uniref:VOC family protein n=1 Tax=Streptomyces crystallinus TaxID=68191 RepID=A0ABN1FCA3_9ACTN